MPKTLQSVEVERPWNGRCATTGLTMDDFAERVDDQWMVRPTSDAVKRAAIAICRAYGIRGLADPAYIANTITREMER
jgi:hypothetical protein